MTDTPDDLRRHTSRLRRGVVQIGVIETILDRAEGPWLGAMDADGRGAVELKVHLAGHYRLTAVVTSVGKLSLVHLHTPTSERTISSKPALRQGWDDVEPMPKQPEWLDHVLGWVRNASEVVDRGAVVEWRLKGADRKLAAMNDTIDSLRADLRERERLRDELASEITQLRTELDSFGQR